MTESQEVIHGILGIHPSLILTVLELSADYFGAWECKRHTQSWQDTEKAIYNKGAGWQNLSTSFHCMHISDHLVLVLRVTHTKFTVV